MWVIDGELDVVEVAALAGDEARVLGPLDAACRRGVGASSTSVIVVSSAYALAGAAAPSRIVAAAARIAATMFW